MITKEIKGELHREIADLYLDGIAILTSEARKQGLQVPGKLKSVTSELPVMDTPVQADYQSWYSKALKVIEQLLPDRLDEFVEQYKVEKRKEIVYTTYGISDYLLGIRVTRGYPKEDVVDALSAFMSKFQHQLFILNSAKDRLDSLLSNIEGVLQAELFDTELSTAEDLLKKKHFRASGAVAGVTLESHLATVTRNRGIKFRKKTPGLSDFNQALKDKEVIDTPTWRLVQRLADIRNLCVHAKDREPTQDEVNDLIVGTKKIIGIVF